MFSLKLHRSHPLTGLKNTDTFIITANPSTSYNKSMNMSDRLSVFICCISERSNCMAIALIYLLAVVKGLHCGDYKFDKSADCRDWSCSFCLIPKQSMCTFVSKYCCARLWNFCLKQRKSHMQVQETLYAFTVILSLCSTIGPSGPLIRGLLGC